MKYLYFNFVLVLLLFSSLQSHSFPSSPYEIDSINREVKWADSLNMNLIGMWNFGFPYAIFLKEDILFVGSGGSVIIFDVSNNANPVKIAKISFPGIFVRGIFVKDTLMFVGNSGKGLRIANISDILHPFEIGSYDSSWTHAVFVRANLAYATEVSKLVIYDVSNPEQPIILSKHTMPKPHGCDVIVKDEFAYVADGQAGLRIIDISDSTNPFEAGYYIPPGYTQSLAICCDTLLLLGTTPAGHQGGLWLINIENPFNPYPMGCDTSIWSVFDISYFGYYAYVGSYISGFNIINFTDPSNPFLCGTFFPPYLNTYELFNVNIRSFIYVCEWYPNALRTIDASEPTNPVSIDYDLIPDRSIDVSVQGDYAYVANCASGVYILDVSDSSNPEDISHYDTKGSSNSIIVKDSVAYVVDSTSIVLLSVKDPFGVTQISELSLPCTKLVLNFPYLYVTSKKSHQFTIVDVSNPQNPFITGICDLGDNHASYICYKDSIAFVSANPQGMAIINAADVNNPVLITYLTLPLGTRGMGYRGNYLYTAAGENLIYILDISEPTNPVLVNTVYTRREPSRISISDTLLYVLFQFTGIEVFNISSPLSPQSVGYYCGRPLLMCNGITTVNGLAYLAADNGIYIFKYTGGSGKKEKLIKEYSESNISFKCYPSIFSSKMFLEVSTGKEKNIMIELYDIVGRKIKDIFTGKLIGKKLLTWDGLNEKGNFVSSGIYFVRLRSGDFASVKKIILVR